MIREPEPEELMDDPAQAQAYADADFSEANELFVKMFRKFLGRRCAGRVLDLGCGPADICIAIAQKFPKARIDALDGAPSMLATARQRLDTLSEDVRERVTLIEETIPSSGLPAEHYDAVISNSLLHHLGDPLDLWLTVLHALKPGGRMLVMDLRRPQSEIARDALVETHALNEPEVLRRDFRNSLSAAYTVDEVKAQLRRAGVPGYKVGAVSDRHLAVIGLG